MKKVFSNAVFAGLLGTCALYGDQQDIHLANISHEVEKAADKNNSKRDRFYLGPDVFYTDQSPKLKGIQIKDKSVYYGLKGGYDYLNPGSIYFGGHAVYAVGKLHIKAENKDKTKLYDDKTSGSFANAEIRLGYNLSSVQPLFITPFVGFGGYKVRPFSTVNFTQDWVYAAVGMKADLKITSFFNIGVNVKGTRAIYLEQRIKKNKYVASYDNNSNALGYEISVPMTLKTGLEANWDMRIEPYYVKLNTHNDSNLLGGQLNLSVKY